MNSQRQDNIRLSRVRELWHFRSTDWTQDEMMWWMDITVNGSWDIPSALGSICNHDLGGDFPMHYRDWADPNKYPSLADWVDRDNRQWDKVEAHFKEVHGLDLTDPKINWSFDT